MTVTLKASSLYHGSIPAPCGSTKLFLQVQPSQLWRSSGGAMDKSQVREWIRRRVRTGALPVCKEMATYAGYGNNDSCSCCGASIGLREVEYDVYFDQRPVPFRMHLNCYRIWREERDLDEATTSFLQRSTHGEYRDGPT